MVYVLCSVFGLIVGVIISRLNAYGTIKIDTSNPEKDVYKLEIKDLDVLPKKKRIVLKIDAKARFSQE